MDWEGLLERTLAGLGYELVDVERINRGRLVRVFLDKPGGVGIDDCAAASRHLSKFFAAEKIDYDRLEVSSPGLDRPLKRERDFARFKGARAHIKLKAPLDGRKNFAGTLREVEGGVVQLETDGALLSIELSNVERARLVPEI